MPAITKALVIYHANCDDGFGAAFAFHTFMEPTYSEVKYHPGVYGEQLPAGITDKETSVWILDFSYDPETLCSLANYSGNVTILDHHKTAKEACDRYFTIDQNPIPHNLHITFDQTRSGAVIAYELFKPEGFTHYDQLFYFLQDRDLWTFHDSDTKLFTQYLRACDQTFDTWQQIASDLNDYECYNRIMHGGALLLKQYEKQCQQIAENKRPVKVKGICGFECNCPGAVISDVGNLLAKEAGTFAHLWYLDSKGNTKHSLRSVSELDVSAWAKELGGGGHKNAAGFYLDPDDRELMYKATEMFKILKE